MKLNIPSKAHSRAYQYLRISFVLPLSLICYSIAAQSLKPVSIRTDSSYKHIYKTYMTSVGASANLYNGTEYTASYPMTNGTPFWEVAEFRNGNISYEGIVYKDIPIIYDLVTNEILIRGIRQQIIKLDIGKINFFEIAGHRFIRFIGDTTFKNLLPEDIYDLVYDDDLKVYVKRKKQVARNISENGRYDFIEYHSYFVFKDGMFYQVTNRKDVLKIFRDKGEQIKTFWKQNRVDFRKNAEQAIIQTVNYYSRLKPLAND